MDDRSPLRRPRGGRAPVARPHLVSAVIEVTDLGFRYPGAAAPSLEHVDLTIERGDFVAVVGGNGSGKTTLCKSFNGLIPHYWSGEFSGSVLVSGHDTTEVSVARLSHLVGYVYQDFTNQLVRPTVHDEVSFGPVNYGLADHAARTEEAMERLGIAHLRDRFVWQLSGGQQHLVALASVLAMRPEVIIVDEPVAELDPVHAEQVYERLSELNRTLGTTIIVIEHHAEFVARYCRSVVLMSQGTVAWHLPVRDALSRADELAEHGIPAPQVVHVSRALTPDRPVSTTVDELAEAMRGRVDHPGAAHPPAAASTATADETPAACTPVVAELDSVHFGYRTVEGRRSTVLDGVDLRLHEGQRVALVGGNGAGKSTLLRLLTGLKVPLAGEVVVDGTNTRTISAAELADRVSYLHQHPEQMFLNDTVRADIAMFPRSRARVDALETVETILERMNLLGVADRDGRMLSGGQQRRATLGIGLAMTPLLLLLDEPTSSLDVATRNVVIEMLADLSDRIRCVVVATHDMHLVAEWADRVVVLGNGRVLRDCTPRDLFADADLLAEAMLVPPQVTQVGIALGAHPPVLSVAEFTARFAATAGDRSHERVGS
ncbi:ABC transporter ATP-binding protein [Marisediminicola sp. LYQ85]|uniref:ABC transporter ATP-binding protein n=1 Tax=Marisediminicola sp. LYQ85 TaxID=3391062 RepID=UPI003982E283